MHVRYRTGAVQNGDRHPRLRRYAGLCLGPAREPARIIRHAPPGPHGLVSTPDRGPGQPADVPSFPTLPSRARTASGLNPNRPGFRRPPVMLVSSRKENFRPASFDHPRFRGRIRSDERDNTILSHFDGPWRPPLSDRAADRREGLERPVPQTYGIFPSLPPPSSRYTSQGIELPPPRVWR